MGQETWGPAKQSTDPLKWPSVIGAAGIAQVNAGWVVVTHDTNTLGKDRMKTIQKMQMGVAVFLVVAGAVVARTAAACGPLCAPGRLTDTCTQTNIPWNVVTDVCGTTTSWVAGSGQEIYANLGSDGARDTPICVSAQGMNGGNTLTGCFIEDDVADGASVHNITSACNNANAITANWKACI